MAWSEDLSLRERNKKLGEGTERKGEGGLEWAAWLELTGEDDRVSPSTIAFFADMFNNTPEVGLSVVLCSLRWTLTLNISFHPVIAKGTTCRRCVSI
jgi:hypothetical protein